MDTKEVFKERIEAQLSKWKSTIEGLKTTIAQAEVDAKAKLHDQLDSLHDKRAKAEKILEDISATSHDAWDQVKSGAEQGWTELSRAARNTMAKVQEAIAKPKPDEEIRQIAYQVWRDEGCPDGRHLDHWVKAESIWHARQEVVASPAPSPRAKVKRARKTATPAKSRARKSKTAAKEDLRRGPKDT